MVKVLECLQQVNGHPNIEIWANSADPDQTAPRGAV